MQHIFRFVTENINTMKRKENLMKKIIKPFAIALLCASPLLFGKTFVPVFAESPLETVQSETNDK